MHASNRTRAMRAIGQACASNSALVVVVSGAALIQAGLIMLAALSLQLTETPLLTETIAPRGAALWRLLFPVLTLLDQLHPHVIGPDRTRNATIALVPFGFILAALGYGLALLAVNRSRPPLRVVFGAALVFQVTMLAMPGMYSADVFSYALYGRMGAIYGLNPYIAPPATVNPDPLLGGVGWPQLTSPYGPLWTDVSYVLVTLTRQFDPIAQVFAYKLLMNAVHLATVVVFWWLSGRLRWSLQTRIGSFMLFAWNPLVVFETAGNGHNDELMVLLLLLAFVPLVSLAHRTPDYGLAGAGRHRWAWPLALACVCMAILVKYLAVFSGLVCVCAWLARQDTWRGRFRVLAVTALLGAGMLTVFGFAWSEGLMTPLATLLAGGDGHVNSLRESAAPWLANNIIAPYASSGRTAHAIAHTALDAGAFGAFSLYLVMQLRKVWVRHRPGQLDVHQLVSTSAGLTTAALLLLLIQVLAWYFVTPLALASLAGRRSIVAVFTATLTLTFLPVYYLRHYAVGPDELLALYVAVPILIAMAIGAWRGVRATKKWTFALPRQLTA